MQGGCSLSLTQEAHRQEWENQRQEMKMYFYIVKILRVRKGSTGWSTLTTSPYLDIFVSKFTHMEQAGIMERLQHQYHVFKPMEPDVLKPLKLEHFYITLFGIFGGMFLALVSFIAENMGRAKQICCQTNLGQQTHRITAHRIAF